MAEAPVTTEPTLVNTPVVEPVAIEKTLYPDTPSGEGKTTDVTGAAATEKPVETVTTEPAKAPDAAATTEEKSTETKAPTEKEPEQGKPPAKPSPTDYDLQPSKDSLLSPDEFAETVKLAKDKGFTKEQAEVFVSSKDQSVKAFKTRQDQAFAQVKSDWKKAVANDPEMGGERISETALLASRGFSAIATPALQKLANETGMGDHPEFVRAMVKVGRMISEDRIHIGIPGTTAVPKDNAAKLYGKTTPNESGQKTP